MEHLIEIAVGYFRIKLSLLLEREASSFDELYLLVNDLLDLQEEFQALVQIAEDISNSNLWNSATMDSSIQLCFDVIRQRLNELLFTTMESPEENYRVLHELSEIREELDELTYLVIML